MKIVEVSAAIIIKDNKIFVTQRGYGEFKDGWEFPGGKRKDGETFEDALIREIKEELDAEIAIKKELKTIEYDYPTFHLYMKAFICELKNGHLSLLEHEAAKFVNASELDNVDFLPADLLLLKDLKNYISSSDNGVTK